MSQTQEVYGQQYQQYQQQPYGQPPPAAQYGQVPPQNYPPPPSSYPPPPAPPQAAPSNGTSNARDHGTFEGGTYSITHRDTNSVLTLDLTPTGSVRSRPGAMIHMAGTVHLAGKVKFSMKKLISGGEMSESAYTGPGRLALAPRLFGDIITLPVDAGHTWTIGKEVFLACSPGVTKETKSQGIGKALFSGEDLFIYRVSGQGLMWLTSFGAVDRLDLAQGEQHIVDNGHLVAWNCDYKIEKAGSGGFTGMKTGEGLVCRFTGPGAVYVQTRNSDEFEEYIRSLAPSN